MKELGLADEHALQSWFVQRMEKFVATKGKRIMDGMKSSKVD